MIKGNERLIIVVGMAHSGTTIISYILKQHPNVVVAVDGNESWILENTALPKEDNSVIQRLIDSNPKKYILMKRPWNCVYHTDWMSREMHKAKYIYCQKTFSETNKSWSKRLSFIEEKLRNSPTEEKCDFYNMCLAKGTELSEKVPYFYKVHHSDFSSSPEKIINELAIWIGLKPFKFDLSKVNERNIKFTLKDEWYKRKR
jgi:hypothetical protein